MSFHQLVRILKRRQRRSVDRGTPNPARTERAYIRQTAVVILRHAGMTPAAIAAHLGVSLATIYRDLDVLREHPRALRRLPK